MTRFDREEYKGIDELKNKSDMKAIGVPVTPTLVVGLGGTGMKILSLFKQRAF